MTKRSILEIALIAVVVTAVLGILGGVYFMTSGVSAKPVPGRIETIAAHTIRDASIALRTRNMKNPVALTDASIAAGRDHFADHCAVCHGNDGSGDTEMGRGLYPRPPDMRLAWTQDLTDGQLFYIIENGVRLTGMPGWGIGTKEGEEESWHLVNFIRHLPKITDEEVDHMASINPKSPEQIRQEIEAEQFLNGGEPPTPEPSTESHQHGDHHE